MLFVLLFNLSLLVFRLLYILYYPLDLTPEEAQYWDWSRHLDLSYYSKPPMVAYLNFLSTKLLGNTELAVRIWPVMFSFLLSILTYRFIRKLYDEKTAIVASTLPQLSVGLSINSILMTTDAPFIFFWSLSVIILYFAFEKNTTFLWLLVGLTSGLTFLSKYTAVFLLPCSLLYAYFVKKHILRDSRPYLALAVAFMLSSPVLYWNYIHGFVSFKHVSTLATKGSGLFNVENILEFLGGQALLTSLIPFFFMLWGWLKAYKDQKLFFFFSYSFPVFVFFMLLAVKKRVEANWTGFAYFAGFILASYFIARNTRWILPSYVLSSVLFVLIHFTPILDKLGLTRLLPPENDPVKVGIGWKALGLEVSKMYTGRELVFSPQYQISAELAFYVKGNPRTYCINLGRRMNQYDLWRKGMEEYIGKDAIFVDMAPVDGRVLKAFEGIIEERTLPVVWRGKVVKTFYIYKLRNYRGGIEEAIPAGY